MKYIKKVIVISVLSIVCLAGCVGKPLDLSNTNKDVELSTVDFSNGRNIQASASGFQLLLLIPAGVNSRHDRALNSLKWQAGDDYISDIKVQESWSYGFVGTVYTTTVLAKAYPIKK